MGNHEELFKLTDGSIWEVQFEYEYMYEYYPDVIACPSQGKIILDGKKLSAKILTAGSTAPSANVIESRIDGEFSGWEGETIVKLLNGQIWQQVEYRYEYRYAYSPSVTIYNSGGGYSMMVAGTSKAVRVEQLK